LWYRLGLEVIMLFPAAKVIDACTLISEKSPDATQRACKLLLPDPPVRLTPSPEVLIAFLRNLPGPEEQIKIMKKLTDVSEEHRIRMDGFFWWDIARNENWLFANIVRDGRTILVCFVWKTVKKGAYSFAPNQSYASWERDITAPNGWRFAFYYPEYHVLIGSFMDWLNKPLTHPPFVVS